MDDSDWLELVLGTADVDSKITVSVFVPRAEVEQWWRAGAMRQRSTTVGESVVDLTPPEVNDEDLYRLIGGT